MTSTLNPEAIIFVSSLYPPEGYEEPMTLSDAVYNMCSWLADGVEIPEGVTPEDIMNAWNSMLRTASRYADMDMSDDDETI